MLGITPALMASLHSMRDSLLTAKQTNTGRRERASRALSDQLARTNAAMKRGLALFATVVGILGCAGNRPAVDGGTAFSYAPPEVRLSASSRRDGIIVKLVMINHALQPLRLRKFNLPTNG